MTLHSSPLTPHVPNSLRLFVAIELPPHTRAALAAAIEDLRHDLRGPFRWVATDSMHLTLKFLGDVESTRAEALAAGLEAAVAGFAPLTLGLQGTGTFPARGSPRVLWAGVSGATEVLMALQVAVEQALVAIGLAPQDNAFHPHLTLARVRDHLPPSEAAALRERLQALGFGQDAAFDVRAVSLVHSTLTPRGSVYRTLVACPLAAHE